MPYAALAALQAAGGIIAGKNGQKAIDPKVLQQLFGTQAITDQSMQLFNNLVNSPVGQQMMTQAAQQGQQFNNDLNSKLAAAGFSGGDASSPIAAFSGAAGGEAAAGLQRNARAQLFSQALDSATSNVNNQANIWAGSQAIKQQQPTFGQQLGSAISGAAGVAAAGLGGNKSTATNSDLGPGGLTSPPTGGGPTNGFGGGNQSNNANGLFGAAGVATPVRRKRLLGFMR